MDSSNESNEASIKQMSTGREWKPLRDICQPHLLNLPQEILDNILNCLLPSEGPKRQVLPPKLLNECSHYGRFSHGTVQRPHAMHSTKSWRDQCLSLRLTCRFFADQPTILGVLFHTFFLYPMEFSIANLEALSKSEKLIPHVRQLVFMRPQFEVKYRDYEAYRKLRVISTTELLTSIVKAAQGGVFVDRVDENQLLRSQDEAEDLAIEHSEEFCHAMLYHTILAGHAKYLECLAEQEKLFSSDRYVQQGAMLVSRLSNLNAVIVCGGDSGLNPCAQHRLETAEPATFLELRYPTLQMGYYHTHSPDNTAFLADILRLITLAQIQPLELALTRSIAISPRLTKPPLSCAWQNLNLKRLQMLDITIAQDEHQHRELPFSKLFGNTLSSSASTLQTLALRGGTLYGQIARTTCEAFLSYPFSALTLLAIDGVIINGDSIAHFISRATALKNMEFVWTSIAASVWRRIFFSTRTRSLRLRIHCSRFGAVSALLPADEVERDFTVFDPKRAECNFEGLLNDRLDCEHEDDELEGDLKDYLWSRGQWSTRLRDNFGAMEESES